MENAHTNVKKAVGFKIQK